MSKILYPLRFNPFFQHRIWGGNQLRNFLKKSIFSENIGESWEISDIQDYSSIVNNGPLVGKSLREIIAKYKDELLGEKVWKRFFNEFPLLIKFIDTRERLSIQVHPDDLLAKKRHNCFGKNEMWYIIRAKESAELILGFNKKISKESYQKLSPSEKKKTLNKIKVKKDQVYYLPSGCVHAIGSGILLAEIQQSSDITYRIYDYNRKDKNGKTRELHEEMALEAIDFSLYKEREIVYKIKKNLFSKVIDTPYFKMNILSLQGGIEKKYTFKETFKIFIVIKGDLEVQSTNCVENLKIGDTFLLPASIDRIYFYSTFGAKILEIAL